MSVEIYNGWWISPISSEIGPSAGSATAYQIDNASKIYVFLTGNLGWTANAACAAIGNIQVESWLNPADVTPSIGNTINDLDNNNALNYPNNAYGLVQWKGLSSAQPITNQIVSYAIRYGYEWYDGEIQLQRLGWEYFAPAKFHPQTVDGVYWTFAKYAQSTASPSQLAKVWMVCYEGTYSVLTNRQGNAERWFEYFGGSQPIGSEWIAGEEFANLALAYDGEYMPYSQYDCLAFVNLVWHDIPDIPASITLGSDGTHTGTNTLWRSVRVFQTTDPYGNNPTGELYWKGLIDDCIDQFGEIPAGALLFHKIPDNGNPPIPPYYAGDGIGNFVHVGIYCGNNQVMQSGGQDSGSVPGGGVHLSQYDSDAWNYCAFVVYVDCANNEPPEPPRPPLNPAWYRNFIVMTQHIRERKCLKNVKRIY